MFKRILAAGVFLCSIALAQNPNTAAFPGAIANDNTLLAASDNAITPLAAAITSTQTTIPLTNSGNFIAPTALTIGGEKIFCPTLTGGSYTGCTRGWLGTSAASAAAGTLVYENMISYYHNQDAAEIKAVESALGINFAGGGVLSYGTSQTLASVNNAKLSIFNGSSLTATLPNPPPAADWTTTILNVNSSALTIDPNGLSADGSTATFTLNQYQNVKIWTDGSNYFYGSASTGVSSLFTSYQFGSETALTGSSIYLQTLYPNIFSLSQSGSGSSGSPYIDTIGLASEPQNYIAAGPASGGAGAWGFRQLAVADLPTGIPNANLANSSILYTVPAWLSVNSPVSLGGTVNIAAATGQSSHQVVGTCGSATTVTLCALQAVDIPTLSQATTVNGVPCALNGTCNINGSSAAHSVALNEGSGVALGAAAIGTGGRILIDQGAGSDPAFESASGDATVAANGAISNLQLHGVAYPASPATNTVPVVTAPNTVTYEALPNSAMANPSLGINATSCTLGTSCFPYGGVNVYTTNHLIAASDIGKLVVMNCASACVLTFKATPALTDWWGVESIGASMATISLNSLNFNGSSVAPILVSDWDLKVSSDGSNYFGTAPPIAGANIAISGAPNGVTFSASGGGGGGNLTVEVSGTSTGTAAAILNLVSGNGILWSCVYNPSFLRNDCTTSYNPAVIASHLSVENNELFCNSTNGTTSYTCNLPNFPLPAYQTGQVLLLNVDTSCSTTCSVTINSLASITLTTINGSSAPNGALIASEPQWIYFDGTVFRLLGNGTGGSGPNLQTNSVNNSSQTTYNLSNSTPYQGLTVTANNTSGGTVQLGLSGTLNNGGLTNSSITVNGVTCTLGSSCSPGGAGGGGQYSPVVFPLAPGSPAFALNPRCTTGASPANCGAYAQGAIAIPTGTNPTLTVETAAVNAYSVIQVFPNSALSLPSTTCNTTLATTSVIPVVTAIVPGQSFTLTFNGTISGNPDCLGFVVN